MKDLVQSRSTNCKEYVTPMTFLQGEDMMVYLDNLNIRVEVPSEHTLDLIQM